ncbi:zinc ribbon domain-containing protein [Acerihabitans arboris]|uniref:Primosomal protein N' (Replication factor Y)-superfamily II helicase n=1 Tax=Acerihabitans arboris TaxID=2691583 RepID=A0A845SNW1_9GAMM|nr:zinc ribbon domain-containing protein [Acerihabitans arboris]NDL65749.1 hypothetical protein [Acerihabitans arboris]
MESPCPVCARPMAADGEALRCEHCRRRYQPQALCPDCGQPLAVLKACGAVDYFCFHGDGLVSRKRIDWRYSAL